MDMKGKKEALEAYNNSGYNQNIYGHYYNIWIEDYDADYRPWEDEMFNPYLGNPYKHFPSEELLNLITSLSKRTNDIYYREKQSKTVKDELKRRGIDLSVPIN